MADNEMLELGQTIRDEPSFMAPEGDYHFMVKGWDTSMYQPRDENSKIPACRQVDVTLLIPYRDEMGNVVYGQKVEHFKLLARLKFAITRFFIACGIGKRGDEFRIDFDQCVGKVGTCKVQQQAGGNGNLYASIEEFYAPDVAPQVTMNDGMSFMEPSPQQPVQPMQQPTAGYGYGY
ncbi:MAG: hypothetical protein IJ092_05530 [Atopobiaceae bacterium]|nr:hypothetical protein [Atopobiaceae bacterium]MBR1829954.1 hypothetical protein [Atopobiaceae bacterium]